MQIKDYVGLMLFQFEETLQDFCFQGSCYDCEMEVVGGAQEVLTSMYHLLYSILWQCNVQHR
jgi:hypothetical protein